MTPPAEKILVMGVGNPLMRDDGVGPRVVELLLDGYEFPDNVEVIDAGTMSFMILNLLRDIDRLIVVDAVQNTGHPAGSVMVLTPADIAPNSVRHSMHDTALIDVLQAAAFMLDRAPEAICVGVQIDTIEECVLDLSPACQAAVPIAAAAVLDELRKLGVTPVASTGSDAQARVIGAIRSYGPMTDRDTKAEEL